MTTGTPLLRHARLCLSLLLTSASLAFAQVPGQSIPTQPTVAVTQSAQGFDATIGKETLRLVVCSDSILHITTRPTGAATNHPQPWLLPPEQSCKGAPFQFAKDEKLATLKTANLTASISLARGNIALAETLVHSLDTQTPQVLIEARIVEARTSFSRSFGIQWGGGGIASAATGNPTGISFPSTVGE